MATTTNFGWTTPNNTDLVKDGAAAIRTLGNGIDTSLVKLKGGTTGQILSKASNTDLDYTWITNDVGDITAVTAGTGISGGGTSGAVTITNSMATTIDAKGDLIVGTGADAFDRLAVGTNGHVLTADSTTTTGTKWAAPASGLTFITRNSFSNVAGVNIDSIFTTTYENYLVIVEEIYGTALDDLQLQFRYGSTTQTANYYGGANTCNYLGTAGTTGTNNLAHLLISTEIGNSTYPSTLAFHVTRVGDATDVPFVQGTNWSSYNAIHTSFSGYASTARVYTGLRFTSSSGNIYGVVSVYGYAKA